MVIKMKTIDLKQYTDSQNILLDFFSLPRIGGSYLAMCALESKGGVPDWKSTWLKLFKVALDVTFSPIIALSWNRHYF